MKRMNPFKFALLGATALTLVACGESNEDVLAYQSVEACIKAGQYDAATCNAEFEKAKTEPPQDTRARMRRFIEVGGQTREGELNLDALLEKL